MTTTLTIGGMTIDLARYPLGKLVAFSRSGYPTLSFYRRGGPLPGLPDPWLGKQAVLQVGGITAFTGDVVSSHPEWNDHLGWVVAYQCLGLRHRGDRIPHTDSNTGTDSSAFNLPPEDPLYNPARAGRTVGQILETVLTMPANGVALAGQGIGNLTYTPASNTYALPAATASDLAALDVIPPAAVYVRGEKLLGAVEGFLAEWAPNHLLWIDPAGTIRVLDLRTFVPQTFVMGVDPVAPGELSRDWSDCYSRVVVRGQPVAVMALLKLSLGQLQENFAHDGLTNAQAKAQWTPAQFHQPSVQDQGSCSCPATTTVTVTSANPAASWAANFWDQTSSGTHGTINLSSSSVTGLIQYWTARVVANTALSPGGTSSLSIDAPLPHLNFDRYTLTGLAQGAGVVWTQYQITNPALWPALTSQSTYPQPFVGANGGVLLTSSPIGVVLWSSDNQPPYQMFPLPFTYDTSSGNIRFAMPTYTVSNNMPPADVWALIPVNVDSNQAVAPPNTGIPPTTPAFAGTCHTVEGISDTLVVTCDQFRDPAQLAQMQAYAQDLLDSVKDTVVEGSLTYFGLFQPALTPGIAVNVAGSGYVTGWEDARLPVVEVELEWLHAGPTSWRTILHASNRRSHYTSAKFLRPERTWTPLGDATGPFNALFGPRASQKI